ncbi:histidine--tRNA ligase [Kocuria rhizophila]|nr:histidine--tRNA ligase [Kocuria rhizophila]
MVRQSPAAREHAGARCPPTRSTDGRPPHCPVSPVAPEERDRGAARDGLPAGGPSQLHGFSIQTRAAETVEQPLRKGEIDKEAYGVSRLHQDADVPAPEGALALHFDRPAAPFARYVVENGGHLTFRFAATRSRGLRKGAREFDAGGHRRGGDGTLPFRYDVELALVIVDALSQLPIPAVRASRENGSPVASTAPWASPTPRRAARDRQALRRSARTPCPATSRQTWRHPGAGAGRARARRDLHRGHLLRGARARSASSSSAAQEGLAELAEVVGRPPAGAPGKVVADLDRPLVWTTTPAPVYETVLVGHEEARSGVLWRARPVPREQRKKTSGVGRSDRRDPPGHPHPVPVHGPGVPCRALCRAGGPQRRRLVVRRAGRRRRAARPRDRHEVAATAQRQQIRYAERRGFPSCGSPRWPRTAPWSTRSRTSLGRQVSADRRRQLLAYLRATVLTAERPRADRLLLL